MTINRHLNDIYKTCEDLRSFLIDKISKEGGYLSDNLSSVETCVAISNVIKENDVLVVDDKSLTLALNELNLTNIIYNNSNSLSYCLGLLDSNKYNHIYLLLNSINDDLVSTFVHLKTKNINYNKLTIIFNDNNNTQLAFINKNPILDNPATKLIKNNLKKVRNNINNKSLDNIDNTISFFKNHNPFDASVFSYIRIDDDIDELIKVLKNDNTSKIELIHYLSIKGKGYLFSQENPYRFFYTKPFNIATGRLLSEESENNLYTKNIVGKAIESLIKEGVDLCCLINNSKIDYGINNIISKYTDKVIEKDLIYKRLINYGLALSNNKLVYLPMLAKDFNENIYLFKDSLKMNGNLLIGVINNSDIDFDVLKKLEGVYIYETSENSDLQNLIHSAVYFDKPVIVIFANKCLKYQKSEQFKDKKIGKWNFVVNNDMKGSVIVSSGIQVNNIKKSILDNSLNISLIDVGFITSIDDDIINQLYSNNSKVYVYNSVIESYLKDYIERNNLELDIKYIQHTGIHDFLGQIN